MRKKKKGRADRNYKFTKKKHSVTAAAALFLSFLPLALFIYAVSLSYMLTLRVSIREARKENVIKKVPVTGAVLSVLMLAGWTAVYVLGWIAA